MKDVLRGQIQILSTHYTHTHEKKKKRKKCDVMDMFISFNDSYFTMYTHIKPSVVHVKYIYFLFVSYTSVKLREKLPSDD